MGSDDSCLVHMRRRADSLESGAPFCMLFAACCGILRIRLLASCRGASFPGHLAPHVPLAATRNLRESGEPPMAIVADGRPASPAELARSLISAQVVTKGDFLVLRDGHVPV